LWQKLVDAGELSSPLLVGVQNELTELRREKNNLMEKEGEILAPDSPLHPLLHPHAWLGHPEW
jgi:hypothetical protein